MSIRLFDRTQSTPKPVVVVASAPQTEKRKVGRPKGAMPKRWEVACYRTKLSDLTSEKLYERRFAYFSTAAKVLASLCMKYQGDKNTVVEFVFEDVLPKGGKS